MRPPKLVKGEAEELLLPRVEAMPLIPVGVAGAAVLSVLLGGEPPPLDVQRCTPLTVEQESALPPGLLLADVKPAWGSTVGGFAFP